MPYKTGSGNEKAYKDANGNYVGLVYHEASDSILMMRSDSSGNLVTTSATAAYGRTEYDYDVDKNLIYKGFNVDPNADGSESTWLVVKYTNDVDADVVTKQQLTGVWNDRVSLSW